MCGVIQTIDELKIVLFDNYSIRHAGWYRKGTSIRQAPVFRHLRALRKSPCCWFPASSNSLILHSSESLKVTDCTVQSKDPKAPEVHLRCFRIFGSKCRILVLLRYPENFVNTWFLYGDWFEVGHVTRNLNITKENKTVTIRLKST